MSEVLATPSGAEIDDYSWDVVDVDALWDVAVEEAAPPVITAKNTARQAADFSIIALIGVCEVAWLAVVVLGVVQFVS